VKKQGRHRRS
jgi:hypothetical protein